MHQRAHPENTAQLHVQLTDRSKGRIRHVGEDGGQGPAGALIVGDVNFDGARVAFLVADCDADRQLERVSAAEGSTRRFREGEGHGSRGWRQRRRN